MTTYSGELFLASTQALHGTILCHRTVSPQLNNACCWCCAVHYMQGFALLRRIHASQGRETGQLLSGHVGHSATPPLQQI